MCASTGIHPYMGEHRSHPPTHTHLSLQFLSVEEGEDLLLVAFCSSLNFSHLPCPSECPSLHQFTSQGPTLTAMRQDTLQTAPRFSNSSTNLCSPTPLRASGFLVPQSAPCLQCSSVDNASGSLEHLEMLVVGSTCMQRLTKGLNLCSGPRLSLFHWEYYGKKESIGVLCMFLGWAGRGILRVNQGTLPYCPNTGQAQLFVISSHDVAQENHP